MGLRVGTPAPMFVAETPSNPNYAFASLGGFYILLAFFPSDGEGESALLGALAAHRDLFDDDKIAAFGVLRSARAIDMARDQVGLRWFLDRSGDLSRLYRTLDPDGTEHPGLVLIDPSMRVMATAPLDQAVSMLRHMRGLPAVQDHAATPLHAPVLIVPRVLEPGICRRLIDLYDAQGGEVSGVMREVNGKTVPIVDDSKSRRDTYVTDEGFKADLRSAIIARLLPEIRKAFQFEVTRMERYVVACYDAAEGGFFRPHRDNTTKGTAHRRFACSINLNAEAFEGGDLRFPEFGRQTYRPPTGGAVVFSCSLLHEATLVTRGRRYAFLPFFYDEAAAQVRQENLGFVGGIEESEAAESEAAQA